MEKRLQVQNLRISFRTINGKLQAVRGISFDLYKGETLAIVGESGSGKSVTSKAIMGILAGNAMVEGGEILYDGQDLLTIEEEDFYRLRGDKIAMIFQDPLSSLNPIMRIGKQLTEAMLLKAKARQKSSKINFDEKMRLLEGYMVASDPAQVDESKRMCDEFRRYIMLYIKRERSYRAARESAEEARDAIAELLYLIDKNALHDSKEQVQETQQLVLNSRDQYVLAAGDERLVAVAKALSQGLSHQDKSKDFSRLKQNLETLQQGINDILARPQPDLLAQAYYHFRNDGKDYSDNLETNNAYYATYMQQGFTERFIEKTARAIAYTDNIFLNLRATAIAELTRGMDALNTGGVDALKPLVDSITQAVNATIEPMEIVKDSWVRTFSGSLKSFLASYQDGQRNNERRMRDFERTTQKHNRLTARGKSPTWKVIPAALVDMELVQENIANLMSNLKAHYEALNAGIGQADERQRAAQLVEYLKENAAGIVNRVTKYSAKAKALRLMEEVGIPEPRLRYRQYPFEFSGGMRQRIVIAIALAANPDILICDEPTTALDVTIQSQILELINKLKQERDLSIIFITHDLGVVANMADRIAVMYAGKIVEYGTAEEVFYSPKHPYTWALLSSMPDLETKEKLEAIPGTPPNMIYPPKGDAFAERSRYAMEIDFEEEPPFFRLSDTHWAATWLLHPDAPRVEPPRLVSERVAKVNARLEGNADV